MREIQSGGLGMEIIRCTKREFKEELLKPNQIVEIIDTDRNKRTIAIRSKFGKVEYIPVTPMEDVQEFEHSVGAEKKGIETNPESITIVDRSGIPHRLFVGYNISEEKMERIKEIYGDGK